MTSLATPPESAAETATPRAAPARPPLALGALLLLALVVVAGHLLVNLFGPYGFHRDEFLYLAMGRHLRLWQMDFPPGIAILAEGTRALLGDSLAAIRFGPAVVGGMLVVLSGAIARELGGGKRAQLLAALCTLASPLFLRAGNLFQPVVLDQLWWTLALLALSRIGRAAHARDAAGVASATRDRTTAGAWIAIGVACGLGLLTKFSIVFIGAGIALAILATPLRRALLGPWPWVALLLAAAIGSPSVVGQILLGFPVAGQMRDLQSTQLERVGTADFLGGQALLGPAVMLALVGLVYLLRSPAARPYRAVGWSCAFAFLILLLLHGKSYYVGPIYPTLFAAGAVALERWSARRAERGATYAPRLTMAVVALVVLAFGAVALPFGVPILPPARMARYAQAIGVSAATATNAGEQLALPQDYADMLGWEEQTRAVARVWRSLPPDDRARAVVIGGNYGEAGALDLFGPPLGLPPTVSAAGSYWFFGPGDRQGEVAVTLGLEPSDLAPFYRSCAPAARVTNPWGVPEQRDVQVLVCRSPYRTLQEVWPALSGRN
jgi:hypothetical protein